MDKFKKFPGQPVLSQILDVITGSIIHAANRKHKSNRYYKRLPLRVHLVSLLYGVFSYCNGLRELREGLLACEGKLFHLGLDKAPARSTISDANNNRSYQVFETIYYGLLRQYPACRRILLHHHIQESYNCPGFSNKERYHYFNALTC